jgi:hypothetical protein
MRWRGVTPNSGMDRLFEVALNHPLHVILKMADARRRWRVMFLSGPEKR